MITRYNFIEKTLFLIRKELFKKLPKEATLEEMIEKTKELINEIYK